jgi:hypoxanthine phosphoribosyltransferase
MQGVMDNFDDIVVAIGSGGTACGLALANHLTGSKLKYAKSSLVPSLGSLLSPSLLHNVMLREKTLRISRT